MDDVSFPEVNMAVMSFLIPSEVGNVWQFLLLGSLAALIFSMAKAGFGGGIGLLSTPIMAMAVGTHNTKLALGIMLPILIVADYVILLSWWGKWEWRRIAWLIVFACVGIAVGGVILWLLGAGRAQQSPAQQVTMNAALAMGIGAIALGFVLLQLVRWLLKKDSIFTPSPWQTGVVGLAAGVTSTLAHAAGPVIAMYLLPQRMEKTKFVATTALYYWLGNQLKLVPYLVLGLVNSQTLGAGVSLLPAIAVGALIGVLLHKRVNQTQFTAIVYVLLAGAGIELLRKSLPVLLNSGGGL